VVLCWTCGGCSGTQQQQQQHLASSRQQQYEGSSTSGVALLQLVLQQPKPQL
jgi:hypothetical protein